MKLSESLAAVVEAWKSHGVVEKQFSDWAATARELEAQVSQLEAQLVPLDEYRSEYSKKGCYFPHPLGLINILEEALEEARAQVSQLTAERDEARGIARGFYTLPGRKSCDCRECLDKRAIARWDAGGEPDKK